MSAAGWAAVALLAGGLPLGALAGPAAAAEADAALYDGYRRYHSVCSHCHGPAGLGGSFAPGLLDRTGNLRDFRRVVLEGIRKGSSVMKGYAGDPNVEPYLDQLYRYLAARRDGTLGPGRPRRLP